MSSDLYQYKHWIRGTNHSFMQKEHNTISQGRCMKPGGMIIAVTPEGICVNGDYGINPSCEEMHEMAVLMHECVSIYDQLQNAARHEAYIKNEVYIEP